MNTITISLSTLAIILACVAPFFLAGFSALFEALFFKFSSYRKLEKFVDQQIEVRKFLSRFSLIGYYAHLTLIPILEEVFMRLLPSFFLVKWNASTEWIIIIGLLSSLLFGVFHYWEEKSLLHSLGFRSVIGIILFSLFYFCQEQFGLPIAFCIICTVHLMYNFFFCGLIKKPKYFKDKDWITSHHYQFVSDMDFDEEYEKEMDQYFKEQEKIDTKMECVPTN